MPSCKNDSKRHYSGTEPSPKGKGFCAHACKIGQRKRGRDGKMWVVCKTKTCRRWVRAPSKSSMRPRGRTLRGGVRESKSNGKTNKGKALVRRLNKLGTGFKKYAESKYAESKYAESKYAQPNDLQAARLAWQNRLRETKSK